MDSRSSWTAFFAAGLLVFSAAAGAQMTQRQADSKIAGINGAIDRPAMKRVLMADRETLAGYIASDPRVAAYAIDEAVRRKDLALVPALLTRLANPLDASLSSSAAIALGTLGGSPARLGLRRALRDPRAAVRTSAAVALAPSGDRTTIPALRQALDQPDSRKQIAAASYLSRFGDRASLPRIIHLANELNVSERRYLCTALARFYDPAARRKLESMVRSEPYAGTRAHAALALGSPHNRSSVPALVAALRDRSPDVRYAASKALEAIGDPSAIPALRAAAQSPSPDAANAPHMDKNARLTADEAARMLAYRGRR